MGNFNWFRGLYYFSIWIVVGFFLLFGGNWWGKSIFLVYILLIYFMSRLENKKIGQALIVITLLGVILLKIFNLI
ncbi:hypothetical protein J2Z66_003910 [Paenibacillus eucommiae]|uniref:Uncharacterized protein n=1 Tax=Paenibacillus eucommiae TaxID=1355755 RepID=A0ABS4IXI7_9BACL|nr:hypothetical protein [Paenibacillus eucommiae]